MVIKKSKATNPSWGGRFEDSVNKLAVSYTSSLDKDTVSYTHLTLPTSDLV